MASQIKEISFYTHKEIPNIPYLSNCGIYNKILPTLAMICFSCHQFYIYCLKFYISNLKITN